MCYDYRIAVVVFGIGRVSLGGHQRQGALTDGFSLGRGFESPRD